MAARRTTMFAELLNPDGRIDGDAWRKAHAARTPVASCGCGGSVLSALGQPWEEHFGMRWFAMACDRCGHETEVTGSRQFPAIPRTSLALLAAHGEVERRRLADA